MTVLSSTWAVFARVDQISEMSGSSSDRINLCKLRHLTCIPVAVLLIFSSFGKSIELTASHESLLSELQIVALILFEISLSVSLLFGPYLAQVRLVSIATFGVFLLYSVSNYIKEEYCKCFGIMKFEPGIMIAINCFALFLLIAWHPRQEKSRKAKTLVHGSVSILGCFVLFLLIPSFLVSEFEPSTDYRAGELVVLRPSEWIGKQCPLIDSLEDKGKLAAGEWTLLLVHDECGVCDKVLRMFEMSHNESVAVVVLPPFAIESNYEFKHVFKLQDNIRWFAETPIVMKLQDGLVVKVRKIERNDFPRE